MVFYYSLFEDMQRDREEEVDWGWGELLMMIMIDFQFECLIIHVNESKSSPDNQLRKTINMIIPQLKHICLSASFYNCRPQVFYFCV